MFHLFEDLCLNEMKYNGKCFMRHKWTTVSRGFECYTENCPLVLTFLPTSWELNVFLSLYNGLYIKYAFLVVYSCNISVGNKWFGWTGTSVDFRNRQKEHHQKPGSPWSWLDWSPNQWLFWGSGEVGRKSRHRKSKYPIKYVYTSGESSSFVLVSPFIYLKP